MGWNPFLSYVKNRYIFVKFIVELVPLAVNSGWGGGDGNIFMSMFCWWAWCCSSTISKIRKGNSICEGSFLNKSQSKWDILIPGRINDTFIC